MVWLHWMGADGVGCLGRTHYAEIYLGIPAQRASVIVDTGSHMTALPCTSCQGCGDHTDPLFDMSKSTTVKYVACHDFDSCRSCEQDRCYVSQVIYNCKHTIGIVSDVDVVCWIELHGEEYVGGCDGGRAGVGGRILVAS